VGELRDEICEGLEAADLAHGRDRLRAVRNTFVATVMAVVVLPELQDYIRSLNLDHEVVEMVRELAQRAGAALSSISLGLIAIPKAVTSMSGFTPKATAAEAVPPAGGQPAPPTAVPVTKAPGGQ
jgi:hypothetical protein